MSGRTPYTGQDRCTGFVAAIMLGILFVSMVWFAYWWFSQAEEAAAAETPTEITAMEDSAE